MRALSMTKPRKRRPVHTTPRRFDERALESLRALDPVMVAGWLELERMREKGKYRCPVCGGSSLAIRPGYTGALCMGRCGNVGYDAIRLTQEKLGLRFPEAARWLAAQAGVAIDDQGAPAPLRAPLIVPPTLPPVGPSPSECEELRARAQLTWQRAYLEVAPAPTLEDDPRWVDLSGDVWTPEAARWASSRRLPLELLSRVGWRSCTGARWREIVKSLDREEASLAGLIDDKGRVHCGWADELILMPYWRDEGMDTLRFRALNAQGSWDKRGLINGAEGVSWAARLPYLGEWAAFDAGEAGSPVIICEGESDCMALWACGVPACAIPGAGVWQEGWAALLTNRGASEIILLRDNDQAGEQLALRLMRDAVATGTKWDVFVLEDFKDIGQAHARNELKAVLAHAGFTHEV